MTYLARWEPLAGPWLWLLAAGWRLAWPAGSHHEYYSVLLVRDD